MLMGVVDTMMVGHLSAEALAAVAIGNLYFFTVAVVGMGSLMALDPIISQAVGAGDEPGIARGLQRGVILAGILTVPTAAVLLLAEPAVRWMGQPAELVPQASTFVRVMVPGVLPFYLFIVFRQTLQAVGRIAPIVWVTLLANILNLALNWILIYGHLGMPRLEVAGSALATTISRFALAGALLGAGWKQLGPHLIPWRPEANDRVALLRMLRLGLPIGAQMFFEYGVFALVGILMGRIGTLAVAGHQIALNLASIVFMVPQGVGMAAAVLVGQAVGAADLPLARRSALGAILVGGGFMTATGALFIVAPHWLAEFYSPQEPVLAVAAPLIILGGLFAIFDGLQAVSMGILRGIGDTRAPVVISMVGYWIVGMPISLVFAFWFGLGPPGLWWGLVIGLAVTAAILLYRVQERLRRDLRRVLIDQPIRLPDRP
jgi:MATE family multidrug resistance protein